MKVLISSPRTGSTSYYHQYIEEHNLTLPNVKKTNATEFLNHHPPSSMTLKEKINWLIIEKDKGINYTFKHHINHLKRSVDYYETWFKDFYKNDEIIVLKRKDTWAWFLSFIFQEFINWNHCNISIDEDINDLEDKIKKCWIDYDYKIALKYFFDIKHQLDTVEGNVIYYEDINFEKSPFQKISKTINYSSYFVNINEIKREFDTIHSTNSHRTTR